MNRIRVIKLVSVGGLAAAAAVAQPLYPDGGYAMEPGYERGGPGYPGAPVDDYGPAGRYGGYGGHGDYGQGPGDFYGEPAWAGQAQPSAGYPPAYEGGGGYDEPGWPRQFMPYESGGYGGAYRGVPGYAGYGVQQPAMPPLGTGMAERFFGGGTPSWAPVQGPGLNPGYGGLGYGYPTGQPGGYGLPRGGYPGGGVGGYRDEYVPPPPPDYDPAAPFDAGEPAFPPYGMPMGPDAGAMPWDETGMPPAGYEPVQPVAVEEAPVPVFVSQEDLRKVEKGSEKEKENNNLESLSGAGAPVEATATVAPAAVSGAEQVADAAAEPPGGEAAAESATPEASASPRPAEAAPAAD